LGRGGPKTATIAPDGELEDRKGHVVDHVGTGPAALHALALDPLPDLVLLDIMLPRIDER
jgi:CheY-like chemotaxis protein